MKVSAVTPSADASDPSHPDHDRWVKDVTLKREAEWANRLGLPIRVAEQENQRLLELAERKQPGKQKATKRKARQANHNIGHAARAANRGVTKTAPRPMVANAHLSPCGRCGTCHRCKRERRVAAMCVRANQGDMRFVGVLWRLWAFAAAAKAGTGKFAEMTPGDANRAVIRKLEEVCDQTVSVMGEWR